MFFGTIPLIVFWDQSIWYIHLCWKSLKADLINIQINIFTDSRQCQIRVQFESRAKTKFLASLNQMRPINLIYSSLLKIVKIRYNTYLNYYQIRVQFESREMHFFYVLEKWFSMAKYLPIIVLWFSERGFYKKITWSPVLGVLPMH